MNRRVDQWWIDLTRLISLSSYSLFRTPPSKEPEIISCDVQVVQYLEQQYYGNRAQRSDHRINATDNMTFGSFPLSELPLAPSQLVACERGMYG